MNNIQERKYTKIILAMFIALDKRFSQRKVQGSVEAERVDI